MNKLAGGWPGLALVLGLLGAGCSLDYGPTLAESLENTPDLSWDRFEQVRVVNGLTDFRLEATGAENYEKRKEARFTGLVFQDFDETGALIFEGRVESAEVNIETQDARTRGWAEMTRRQDGMKLWVRDLVWTHKERFLKSESPDVVRLETEEGTALEGRGFEADFRRNRIRFTQGLEGVYVPEPAAAAGGGN